MSIIQLYHRLAKQKHKYKKVKHVFFLVLFSSLFYIKKKKHIGCLLSSTVYSKLVSNCFLTNPEPSESSSFNLPVLFLGRWLFDALVVEASFEVFEDFVDYTTTRN